MNEIQTNLSTDKIMIAAADMVCRKHGNSPSDHLDIGSGSGTLIYLLRTRLKIKSSACDYTTELMGLQDVCVDVVNLNTEKLPYKNESFDIITMTEVVEHLEHYRETLQETFRVLRKNGTLVVTTPNILNLKSRVRFLIFGFYNLFGPLHFKESALHSAGGHITPISLFYLIHSLVDAGYSDFEVSIDKRQSTSMFWLFLLYFPIKFFSKLTSVKEKKKFKTIDEYNEKYVSMMNTVDVLLGRTIVVGCKKF